MGLPLVGVFRYLLNGFDLSIGRALDKYRSSKSGYAAFTTTTGASVYDVPSSRVFHPELIIITNNHATSTCQVIFYDGTGTTASAGETKSRLFVGASETIVIAGGCHGMSFATDCRVECSTSVSTIYVTVAGVVRPQIPSEVG